MIDLLKELSFKDKSCPDTLLDRVMLKVLGFVEGVKDPMAAVGNMIKANV